MFNCFSAFTIVILINC